MDVVRQQLERLGLRSPPPSHQFLSTLEAVWQYLVVAVVLVAVFLLHAETLVRWLPPRLDQFGVLDDLARAAAFGKASAVMGLMSARGRVSGWYIFERTAKRHPNHAFFVFEGKRWTWGQVHQDANRLSRYWLEQGIKKGDTVAVVIPNKPTFVIVWLSFMAIGVAPAFINYNLTGDSLIHCVKVSEATHVVVDLDCQDNVKKVASKLGKKKFHVWVDGLHAHASADKASGFPKDWKVIKEDTYKHLDATTLPHKPYREGITWKDPIVHIYTSGTSGMPKAAPCHQAKFATGALTWSRFAGFRKSDVIYTPLPLYHSSAAFLCVGAAMASGSTVALSRKFSASKFWDEVREANATAVQYIGELARYLLSKEEGDKDKQHRVRMAYGNGMRPDIWLKFKDRFGVKTINEFYASTEGNVFLFNYNQSKFGAGAIGRESRVGAIVAGDYLARVNDEELVRGKSGFCEEPNYKEPGELLIRIDEWHPAKSFHGYKGNKGASDEKILNDVFRKGDMYFRTGDLLSRDRHGFYYFQDRLGDTFRWKGENVATSEVQSAVSSYDGLNDVAVFGVQLPQHDGRAGAVAISKEQFDGMGGEKGLEGLYSHVQDRLPKYALPLFVRVPEKLETTSTHKIVTTNYKKQGVNPDETGDDKVYFLDPKEQKYKAFGKEQYDALENGKLSF